MTGIANNQYPSGYLELVSQSKSSPNRSKSSKVINDKKPPHLIKSARVIGCSPNMQPT